MKGRAAWREPCTDAVFALHCLATCMLASLSLCLRTDLQQRQRVWWVSYVYWIPVVCMCRVLACNCILLFKAYLLSALQPQTSNAHSHATPKQACTIAHLPEQETADDF